MQWDSLKNYGNESCWKSDIGGNYESCASVIPLSTNDHAMPGTLRAHAGPSVQGVRSHTGRDSHVDQDDRS
jgi:hypothetical protein